MGDIIEHHQGSDMLFIGIQQRGALKVKRFFAVMIQTDVVFCQGFAGNRIADKLLQG
jgi:hypothetical protein